ncbi:hypothetical protein P5G51_011365 [Virgibacillus sp. 179-BFC.A HS]|uniref:RecF/RecN/SMC N-terminal domain-containing protein n=1 Tax=Tigheibacillus jepli TaxID=3035914 RepID=A0ABU5CHS8_9BACI|nr:hypothetical protein [Virgibacillus sp. 179-BFC.A HS]MDY0405907.1 hypothetical protein [Virgibacillus sp. 179-BFC.A HS]
MQNDLSALEKQLAATQKEIDELSAKQKELQDNQEKTKTAYYQTQITLAEQDERIKNQQSRTKQLQQELESAKEKYEQYAQELKELIELKRADERSEDIDQIISKRKLEKEQLTKEIQDMRQQRSSHSQWIADQERELKEANKHHAQQVQEIQQKEVHANRLDVELENHLSQLSADYAITYEKAKNTFAKVDNVEETKQSVRQIKSAMEALGTINLGAIDEFKRISERNAFLTTQRDDLQQASATLRQVISEMDTEMKKMFGETFQQIQAEFTVVFKELFGGGHAELKLTDAKNLLETGVDIIAQPPGKKLQNLGLLSGGERALTAIALLFAILRVRPVPFCILDEVEAALDEANVVRFAKYIKTYSSNTQFIVITHRKGTMEQADVLYGVTMQESGVSRLVSVRLEDTKELIGTTQK